MATVQPLAQFVDKIEVWPLDRLIPYAQNARTHTEHQVAQIAASIKAFGFINPILCSADGVIVAGHGRRLAAVKLGMADVPVIVLDHLTDIERRALVLIDNRLAELAAWDVDLLRLELQSLDLDGFDLSELGFSVDEVADLFGPEPGAVRVGATDDDEVPAVAAASVSRLGDVWLCGTHRVMCGDSTSVEHVEQLMAGAVAALVHADPPYGMGKQSDGVLNDNLYNERLDAFQLEWWRAYRPSMANNASAYIWGNAPELWRLWYAAGLGTSERLELCNEIVWDKKTAGGGGHSLMGAAGVTEYPNATERCLFFQLGNQYIGNINVDDFPETWEPLRAYLAGEADTAGITAGDIKRVCGCFMYGHWFTRSQFTLIPANHYATLQAAYPGRFLRLWPDLKREWDIVNRGPDSEITQNRSFFDNTHDNMRDVWEFPRVVGDERHGHATPKPVAMVERIVVSSAPPGAVVVEPFGGTGPTVIAAEKTGRRCYAMELEPRFVDVIVRRWQAWAGGVATREADGLTFDQVAATMQASKQATAQ